MYSAVPPPSVSSEVKLSTRSDVLKQRLCRLENANQKQKQISHQMTLKRRKALNRKKQRIINHVLGQLSTEDKILVGLETDMEKIEQFEREKARALEEEYLNQLRPYYKANERFKPVSHGRFGDKSPLEEALEQAITDGKVDLAEKISNRIALEDNLAQLERAKEGKERFERLSEEENFKLKKPPLHWGFESKHRWESKGNM